MFSKRHDGTLVRDASPLRRMMPFLMPGRNEAVVYLSQEIDLTAALAFLEARASDDPRPNLFHLVLTGLVRTLAERPRLNRFIAGQRLYQRNAISLAFAVKKSMHDDAPMTTVKVDFEPADTLSDVIRRVNARVREGRSDKESSTDAEMRLLTRLPRPGLNLLMRLQRALDGWNLLPTGLTANDPCYASIFVANLGSIALEAPFHHLFEYGTTPIFATIGRVKKIPVVLPDDTIAPRPILPIRYSLDERIEDGFYCARSLERLEHLLTHPEELA